MADRARTSESRVAAWYQVHPRDDLGAAGAGGRGGRGARGGGGGAGTTALTRVGGGGGGGGLGGALAAPQQGRRYGARGGVRAPGRPGVAGEGAPPPDRDKKHPRH